MSLSHFLMNVLSAPAPRAQGDERDHRGTAAADLHRCKTYRKLFRTAEVALPAQLLSDPAVAKWARDQQLAVDVRSAADTASVAAAGIQWPRVTVFADALRESELRAVVAMGVGQIVAGSLPQVEVLRSIVADRPQDVVIRMTDAGMPLSVAEGLPGGFRFDSNESDVAIAAVIDHDRLNLAGLHCEVGTRDDDFVSYPAAIGHMIAEMTQVRRNHGVLLTRLGLGGGRAIPPTDWHAELHQLAIEIDQSLDDACGTLRFPRPLVVLSAALAVPGRSAA